MSHLRFRPLLLAAVLALILPLGADEAASANTAVTSQSGDGATLTLSAKAKRSFSGQHVSLTAQRPATRRKSTYALPDSSGKWNFAKATGTQLVVEGIETEEEAGVVRRMGADLLQGFLYGRPTPNPSWSRTVP